MSATNRPGVPDKTKTEFFGKFRGVIWTNRDEAEPFSILELASGHVIKGPAPPSAFGPALIYRFLGKWVEDKRGPVFKFDTFVVDSPAGEAGVLKYLMDEAPNVGRATAQKLWERYAGLAVKILREEPGRVQEDGLMSLENAVEASKALQACSRLESTKVDLFTLFSGRGFSGKAVDAAIAKWGAKAPQVIKRNPFALLVMKIPGAGFKRCDKMYLDLGKPAKAIKRQALCVWNILRNGDGHTWFPVEQIAEKLKEAIPGSDPVAAIKLAKRAGRVRTRRDDAGKLWLAEAQKAANEAKIALHLTRLIRHRGERLWPDDIPVSKTEGDRLPSEHQRERGLNATLAPVGVLIGSPGTGKTHTLAFILKEVIAKIGIGDIAVCAPTGKAANRATQSLKSQRIDITATTVHRTIGLKGNYDGEQKPAADECHPLSCRVVVVDETSMKDTDLMAALLSACADGTHVLFIGDTFQLPPIGHGAPLRDMIESGVIPVGELTEVRRNAGAIVHGCLRIKNGEQFDTYREYVPEEGKNLMHIETSGEKETAETVGKILERVTKFDPVWASQVIVARNEKGDLSRKEMNKRLHKQLNPEGRNIGTNPFRVGDKVICLRNGNYRVVAPVPESVFDDVTTPPDARAYADVIEYDRFSGANVPVEQFVANGEVGRVVANAESLVIVRVSEGDSLIKIPVGKVKDADEEEAAGGKESGGGKGDGCDWTHAYAVTCHKMQGSEAPFVILVLDPQGSMICDRSWLYTGVSRAGKLCVLVGPKKVADAMLKRVKLDRRKTFLKELLIQARDAGNGAFADAA